MDSRRQVSGGHPSNMAALNAQGAPGGGQAEGEGERSPSPGSSAPPVDDWSLVFILAATLQEVREAIAKARVLEPLSHAQFQRGGVLSLDLVAEIDGALEFFSSWCDAGPGGDDLQGDLL